MHPSLYVFAYQGMSVETCLEQVSTFYKDHPEIPKNRYAVGVIVNKKYIIRYCKVEQALVKGGVVPANTFVGQPFEFPDLGYPYLFLLNDLAAYITWLPYMQINLDRYFYSTE